MHIECFTSLEWLNQPKHSEKPLPKYILNLKLVLNHWEPIKHYRYFLFYDNASKRLYLRYFYDNNIPGFNYWNESYDGQIVAYTAKNFKRLLSSLKKNKQIYFHVACIRQSYINYYPLHVSEEDPQWGKLITHIVIPSRQLMINCGRNSINVYEHLRNTFKDYSAHVNGENYVVCTDTYDLNTKQELIYASESDFNDRVIGLENALNYIKDFEIPSNPENK